MGLFKKDEFKALAKLAFDRVSIEGDKINTFTPFLFTVNQNGETELFACGAATNEEAQDMAYEMVFDIAQQDEGRVRKYAIVAIGNSNETDKNMYTLLADCGLADKNKAMIYGISYQMKGDGTLKKLPGLFKVRETAFALDKKKSFASRAMQEASGGVVGLFTRLPLLLTYLTAFENGSFDGEMPDEVWSIYQNLLMGWSKRKDSIGYLMGAYCLKAVMDKTVMQQMPREGVNKDTLKSALHIGNQLLIEGVKSGRFMEEDLKITMKELYEYASQIATVLGSGQSDSFAGLRGYLAKMAEDPMALSAT